MAAIVPIAMKLTRRLVRRCVVMRDADRYVSHAAIPAVTASRTVVQNPFSCTPMKHRARTA
jgi:hypothetical protein